MRRSRWVLGVAVLAAVAWLELPNASGRADDKIAPEKPSATADDALTVPTGSAEELLAFIGKIRAMKPPQGEAEAKQFGIKSREAIVQAADKILADKTLAATPDDKIRLAAIQDKVGALALLDIQFHDAKAGKEFQEYVAELQKDKDPSVVKLADMITMQLRLRSLFEGTCKPEDAQKLWDDTKAKLAAAPDDKEKIQLAMMVAQALSYSDDSKLAVQAYHDLGDILSKSTDPRITTLTDRFAGIIRRLSLPGHPIELKGTLVGGKPFDPDSLKGKVVLVDFWATWCGPCRAELPNVKKNYEKYHDKGFEVVGISLDDSRDNLEKFLADEQITWPIIFGAEGEPHGWQESIATYYGVSAIPATILVDQKGDVVSLNARGKKLSELLEELLGK